IIFVIFGWIAVVNSYGLGLPSAGNAPSKENNNQPSSEAVKPSLKQCKPTGTTNSEPKDLHIGTTAPQDTSTGTLTPSSTSNNLKNGDQNTNDCEPIPEGLGSRLDAQTLRTLVTKHLPQIK
ncbi:hypothetical protein KR084_005371, partial [Drosophila pseudotakahashii]